MTIERRRYKRYPVSGRVEFMTEAVETLSKLLDIGKGGVLNQSEIKPSPGEELPFRFTVSGYQGAFEVTGNVVRIQVGALVTEFLEELAKLKDLLGWLERREPKKLISTAHS